MSEVRGIYGWAEGFYHRHERTIRWVRVLLLAVGLVLVSVGYVLLEQQQPSKPPVTNPTGLRETSSLVPAVSTPNEQVIGLATSYETVIGASFEQNGYGEFNTTFGSAPLYYDFTNYSDLTFESLATEVSVAGYLEPMVVLTQGTDVLLNNTGTGTFLIYPPSTMQVNLSIPAAFTPGGGEPANGTYAVNLWAQLALEYQSTASSTWSVSGYTTSESFVLSAPAGVWLNQTTVYLPFPLPLAVNYSSVSVNLGGSTYPYTQITTNGVYLSVLSLGPGSNFKFSVSFRPNPTQVGGTTPVIVIKSYSSNPNTGPKYLAMGSWVNTFYTLWGGMYIIELNISYTIDPASVNLSANGHYLKSSNFLVSGDVITILPLAVLTPSGNTTRFTILFNLPSAPPSGSITTTSSTNLLGYTITFGDTLIFLAIVGAATLAAMWLAPRRNKVASAERYSGTFGLIVLVIGCGVAYYLFR